MDFNHIKKKQLCLEKRLEGNIKWHLAYSFYTILVNHIVFTPY